MKLARSISLIFLSRVITIVLGLAGLTIFARIIPSSHLGTFFLFQSLLGLLTIPADLGVRTAITKRVSEGSDRDTYFTSGLVIKISLILVVSLFVFIFRDQINQYLGDEVALLLILAISLQELGLYFMAALKGELRIGETEVWQLLKTIGWTVIGGSVAYLGLLPDALSLILGLIAGMSLMTVLGMVRSSMRLRPPSLNHSISILKFGSFAALESVGAMVYNWTDVLVLGFFVSNSKVAAYEIAWRVAMNITLVSVAVRVVLFPQTSNWHANDQLERVEELLPDFITLSLLVSVPAVVGGALLSEEILHFVFNPEYTVASAALIVLLINMLDDSIVHIIGGGLLYAVDRPDLSLRATAVATVVNVILNVVLIVEYGLVGAAIATTVASLLGTFLNVRYVGRFFDVRPDWAKVIWIVTSSTFMGVTLYIVIPVIEIAGIRSLLGVILFGAVLYFGLILSVDGFRSMIRRTVAEIR